MAATTGTFSAARRSRTAWAWRDRVSPSSELRMPVKSLMSAPAMKLSAFPLRSTTPRTSTRDSSSPSRSCSSCSMALPSMFTRSPGTSRVRTRIPSPSSCEKARAAGTAGALAALTRRLPPAASSPRRRS